MGVGALSKLGKQFVTRVCLFALFAIGATDAFALSGQLVKVAVARSYPSGEPVR